MLSGIISCSKDFVFSGEIICFLEFYLFIGRGGTEVSLLICFKGKKYDVFYYLKVSV